MKSQTFTINLLVLLLTSLPCSIFAQQTISASIQHDNIQRDYILYVPASYTGFNAVPLIFNFHGYTNSAASQMVYGDFRSIADTANFLVVHPMGTPDNTGNAHFNVGWGGSTVDDVGFTEALLDSLSSMYNIDSTRVYSTGMSNGGFMSYQLACQLGNRIAAIASVTGSMSPLVYNNCNPSHPTPILEIHGTADFVVAYGGSPITKSIIDVLQYWTGFDNCNSTPSSTALPNINTNDGSTVEHIIYSGCDNSITVEHFKVINGGHTWPGSIIPLPQTNRDFNASAEIWKFFSRYDINGLINSTTGIGETQENVSSILLYPNPNEGNINIKWPEGVDVLSDVQLTNTLGQTIFSKPVLLKGEQIALVDAPSGMYVFQGINNNKTYRGILIVATGI